MALNGAFGFGSSRRWQRCWSASYPPVTLMVRATAGRWWARYFQDQWFRIDQEARAFAHQYDWWCANAKGGKDRNWRYRKLLDLGARLAAPTYGSVVDTAAATKLIKGFSKTKTK